MAKDWRGTRIAVGSVVVYPSREASRMWMTEGEVVSVAGEKVGVLKRGGKRIAFPALDRITVVG